MLGVIKRLRTTRIWIEAVDAATAGRYQKTIEILDKFDKMRIVETDYPSMNDLHSSILRGFSLLSLRKNSQALAVLTAAQEKIVGNPKSSAQLRYLRLYVSTICLTFTSEKERSIYSPSLFGACDDPIPFRNIPAIVRKVFPLPT